MTGSAVVTPRPPMAEPAGATQDALQALYRKRRDEIAARLREFRAIWREGNDEDLFAEMVFCMCAVQTSARVSDQAARRLRESGLLLRGSRRRVREVLRGGYVRFHETKSGWIVGARRRFMEPNPSLRRKLEGLASQPPVLRDWLEGEVPGLGPKEASHYLRNIGLGENLAILDRHILHNLQELRVIEALPPSLTRSRYRAIERDLQAFCERMAIPVGHMDLLLWAKETGFVFK
ncbi:MAG: DNA lyase [Thermoplasmata archaeon]